MNAVAKITAQAPRRLARRRLRAPKWAMDTSLHVAPRLRVVTHAEPPPQRRCKGNAERVLLVALQNVLPKRAAAVVLKTAAATLRRAIILRLRATLTLLT